MNLTTQDAQVACFQNVAAHLEPGGCFVIEVGLPDLQRSRPARRSSVRTSARARRASTSTTSRPGPHLAPLLGRRRRVRVLVEAFPLRVAVGAGPDGADRGMTPRERWSGWKREPFTGVSEKLVGVWEKPAG